MDVAWRATTLRVQISYNLTEVCRCLPVHVGASSSKSCWKWKESQSLFWQPSLRHWPTLVIWTSTLCCRHISTYGKIKTHFSQTYSHMPPSMYLNMVIWTIRLIETGRLQHQHFSLSHLYTYFYIPYTKCKKKNTHIKWYLELYWQSLLHYYYVF